MRYLFIFILLISCFAYASDISFPGDATKIEAEAFRNNKSITRVVIPEGVTEIGRLAFFDCTNLKSIVIPNSVTIIGEYAFAECINLESISLPNSLKAISNDLFSSCASLKFVNIPDSVTTIGANAFAYCNSLTEITLPINLNKIGRGAFSTANNLLKVTIQSIIDSDDFEEAFPGNLRNTYLESGPGEYTRESRHTTNWRRVRRIRLAGDDELRTIRVSTAREFISAIDSNRIIEMNPGHYLLSDVSPRFDNHAEGVIWFQPDWSESELRLEGIENLTIRAVSGKVELVTAIEYFHIMYFNNCHNIVIEDITAGHTTEAYCSGGVFSFNNSSNITIRNTHMYGCGTEGLNLSQVRNMNVIDSTIYECSYRIFYVWGGENITFENCKFYNNREYELVYVYGSPNLTINNCEFTGNRGSSMFYVDDTEITVRNTIFRDNRVNTRILRDKNVKFIGCEFD